MRALPASRGGSASAFAPPNTPAHPDRPAAAASSAAANVPRRRACMDGKPTPRRLQGKFPGLGDEALAEAEMPAPGFQDEALGFVDRARGLEMALRPEHDPAVALRPGEGDAGPRQATAEPLPARPRIEDQQAQL